MPASAASPSLSLLSLTSKPPPPFSAKTHRLLPTVPNFAPLTLKSLRRNRSTIIRVEDADADGGEPDEEEVDNKKDYDVEYDPTLAASVGAGDGDIAFVQSKSFVSTQGWDSEMVVDYRINEDEFHKISLLDCDFFIRKPPDPDNDVYDFREVWRTRNDTASFWCGWMHMYVTPPDTDIYSIPRVLAPMPQKVPPFNPYWLFCFGTRMLCSGADNGFCFNDVLQVEYIRCAMSDYGCYNVTEPPIDSPRDPLYKSERDISKVHHFERLDSSGR
ncbi:hypothetical protein F2Q69_00061184 [Brassica cretica]|uniref:Uncharacterized protein n=1 Tax=Brassica cretica TaxID=69181 RepID=A0A8S9RMM1_BRACR|nr:hypothetical protein F2Q69_00061184 [Brassica cretica]